MALRDRFSERNTPPLKTYPVKEKNRYTNPHLPDIKRDLWDVILWQLGRFHTEEDQAKLEEPPKDFSYPNPRIEVAPHLPQATWVNHSTFYLQIEGIGVLTDPVFYDRCSPFKRVGPKRLHEVPLQVEDIQVLDLILISHNHYDHVDKKAMKQLLHKFPDVVLFVPTGLKRFFSQMGARHVIELSWWEEENMSFGKHPHLDIRFTCVPSQHFSGRGIFDKNKTLWCGWVMEIQKEQRSYKTLYFVGDTGYNPVDFKQIGDHFPVIDLALIPIGTYVPKLFMSPVHIGPEEAVLIHQEVHAKLSIGMHWRSFKLSSEPMLRPPYDLYLKMKQHELDPLSFRVLEPGQTINW